jgi:predicted permease
MTNRLRSLCRALFRRDQFERGMADELRFHVDQYAEDLVRAGLTPEEAARRARLDFGGLDNVKDDCREARGVLALDHASRAVRHAVRLMRRSPGFTATALITLALCVGANLTIFAVVDAVLLRPLPFLDAERLVTVFNTYPKAGVIDDGSTITNYYERRGKIGAFAAIAMYRDGAAIVGDTGSNQREFITRVTPGFFATLGVAPAMGREFTEEETTFQTDRVVILTGAYWRDKFHADPNVIGQTLRVDGVRMTVVGVLPQAFRFLSSKTQLYFPLASPPEERAANRRHSGSSSHMVARLRPSVSLAEAQAEVDAHNAAMQATDPQAQLIADTGFRSMVVPLRAAHVASIRPTLLLVQAGVLFLLLIGAVNVTNLLLIRANGRVRELSLRQALGESRRHVMGAVLVETTILTVAGGLLGIAVGAAGIRFLVLLGTSRLPLGGQITFDARAAAVAMSGALALGVAIAIPLGWYHLQCHSAGVIGDTRSSTPSRIAQRMRHGFLVAQIALAFVLLAGAALLGLSLERVMAVSPGFRPEHVLSGQVSLPWNVYTDGSARLGFIDRLMEGLHRQPGVLSAGITTNVPLSGNTNKSSATVKGLALRPGESPRGVYAYGVGGDYFTAMGMSLIEGRFLRPEDTRATDRVCVVDETFARQYLRQGNALGQQVFPGVGQGPDSEAFTIVGVVGTVKQAGLAEDEGVGAVYYPYDDRFDSAIFVVVRTNLPPDSFAAPLARVVRTIDPELPVNNVRSMETRIADSVIARRSPAILAGCFSAIAVLLTAIGTYGVLSYAVAQRRREIALRIALGARPGQVRGQFFWLALRLLGVGSFLGLGGAWLTGRALQTILFQVPAVHVPAFAATAGILSAVTLLACLLPSHRAARIAPREALAE